MCNSTRAEDQQDRWRMKVVCSSMHAEDQGQMEDKGNV